MGASQGRKSKVKYIEGDDTAFDHPSAAFDKPGKRPKGRDASAAKGRDTSAPKAAAPEPRTADSSRSSAERLRAPPVAAPLAPRGAGKASAPQGDLHWICPRCDEVNKVGRQECNNCGGRRNAVMDLNVPPAASTSPVRVRAPAAQARGAGAGFDPTTDLHDDSYMRAPAAGFNPGPAPALPVSFQFPNGSPSLSGQTSEASSAGRAHTLVERRPRGSPLQSTSIPAATVAPPAMAKNPRMALPNSAQLSTGLDAQENAALAAIRAALPGQTPSSPAERSPVKEQFGRSTASDFGGTDTWKRRWHNIQVDIDSRKIVLYWLKHARERVKVKEQAKHARAAAAEARKRDGRAKKSRKRDRLDRLVQMYVDQEEHLEQLCMEEPEDMLRAQMDIISHRITSLNAESSKRRKKQRADPSFLESRVQSSRRQPGGAASASSSGRGSQAANQGDTEDDDLFDLPEISTSEALTAAMQAHEDWEKNRDQVHAQASLRSMAKMWKNRNPDPEPSPQDANAALVAQLRAERERLAALLPLFDAKFGNQRKHKEQEVLDIGESMAEARRDAEEEHLREMREKRRLEEERRRRKEEEEERRRRAEAEEAERRRREEEERRRLEEKRRQEEEAHRLRLAEEQRKRREARLRAEAEEDRIRLEMEERELQRQEEERRRAEERRRQEEEQRRAEERWREEERKRQEADAQKAQRRTQAFSLLAREGENDAEPEAGDQRSSGGGAGTRDFLQRAMAALDEADDASSSDEEDDGASGGQPDIQLMRASQAIAAHIERAAAARGAASGA